MPRSNYGPCPLLKYMDALLRLKQLEEAAYEMRCRHAGLDPELVKIRVGKKS